MTYDNASRESRAIAIEQEDYALAAGQVGPWDEGEAWASEEEAENLARFDAAQAEYRRRLTALRLAAGFW